MYQYFFQKKRNESLNFNKKMKEAMKKILVL